MPACASCTREVPVEAVKFCEEWGVEVQCFPCLDSMHLHACLAEDEVDEDYHADYTKAFQAFCHRVKSDPDTDERLGGEE